MKRQGVLSILLLVTVVGWCASAEAGHFRGRRGDGLGNAPYGAEFSAGPGFPRGTRGIPGPDGSIPQPNQPPQTNFLPYGESYPQREFSPQRSFSATPRPETYSVPQPRAWSERQAAQTGESYRLLPPKSLFNGRDLTGWTAREGDAPPKGWTVENGAIRMKEKGDNLYTSGEYEHFILEFEFRIERGANSGLKYKTWKTDGWGMGCEYQIFDDGSAPDQKPVYRTAALYDVYEPNAPTDLFRLGEYNKGKIVVMGNYIEHWLNGVRTVSARVDSPEWKERVAKSKFAEEPNFGHVGASRLFLQDHGSEVWFRNITLTELKPCRD